MMSVVAAVGTDTDSWLQFHLAVASKTKITKL